MIELLTAFPTIVFTVLLGTCLTWWVVTLLISALDADIDIDADTDFFGFGLVPFPLALTLVSAGGFIVCLLGQSIGSTSSLATGTAVMLLVGGVLVGLVVLKLMSKPLGRLFGDTPAPSRTAGVGSVCKVRTLTVNESFGDAEVITGDIRGAIVRVRAKDDRFVRGDLALIIDFDEAANTYVIDDLDDDLKPHNY
jgi:hypothetical protein